MRVHSITVSRFTTHTTTRTHNYFFSSRCITCRCDERGAPEKARGMYRSVFRRVRNEGTYQPDENGRMLQNNYLINVYRIQRRGTVWDHLENQRIGIPHSANVNKHTIWTCKFQKFVDWNIATASACGDLSKCITFPNYLIQACLWIIGSQSIPMYPN